VPGAPARPAAQGLWAAAAATPPFEAPALEGEREVDVAIVGGGFTGLSIALHLAERGVATALLEAHEIGHGASGRNGGQVNPGIKLDEKALAARFGEAGRALHRFGQEAPDFLGALIARKALDCGWRQPGLFRLAHNATAHAKLTQAAKTLKREGVAVEELGPDDVARRVGTTRYPGGLYDPRGASVQPLDLAREMARAAGEAGAAIHPHSPASALARARGLWRLDTAHGRLWARKVAVATNAYSDALVPGLARSLLPVNSFQIATAPLKAGHGHILAGGETVYDSRRLVLYFRRSPDGRLVMGGRASFSSARAQSPHAPDYATSSTCLPASTAAAWRCRIASAPGWPHAWPARRKSIQCPRRRCVRFRCTACARRCSISACAGIGFSTFSATERPTRRDPRLQAPQFAGRNGLAREAGKCSASIWRFCEMMTSTTMVAA
jgi:sarcosine oxidase